jgi:class 3 adenylate cyclase/tetratricopeptide (TPR) repeat protein
MGNTPLSLSLDAYVPRMAAEWDLDAPGALWREMDATCCFVDISGFTALSERLSRRGRIGAEELTEVLNHVFSRMLEVAYKKRGALLKFGGDALLLAFQGHDHATLAAESAVAMRAALRQARMLPTSVGRVNLRMSVGIHSGVFHLFRGGASHREFLITGPAATETTRMEQTADPGEIVVSPTTAERLPHGAVGATKGDGFLLRWRQVAEDGPGPMPARPIETAVVESSIPVALRTRLAQRAGEAEHRLATVGFVKFQGTDDLIAAEGPDAAAVALDAIVRVIQNAADHESVTFLASDIDANGGKIILTTGVPAAEDDDEGRMLRAVRAVIEEALPLPVRIGVNRGHVFSCDIGTAYRRTFTVMGDAVNLAARLMAAAQPGEIYATAPVLDHARTQFAIETQEPFYVKGKSEPVQAYRVGAATGSRRDPFGNLPFLGRDKELATLAHAREDTDSGHGVRVLIDAERGAGKTRLVSEFAATLDREHVLWLHGEPQSTAIPYRPLRSALRNVLGIDATERGRAGTQLVESIRRFDETLIPFAPLLAPIVDADLAPTPETEAIAEEFLRQRVASMVIDVLDGVCQRPLVLFAEDAHWFDVTTSEICSRIAAAAQVRPWLLCVTRRPETTGGFEPSGPEICIQLGPLTDDVTRQLVTEATDSAPLRPHETDSVVGRAGGNPLFLEELVRVIRSADIDALPETLDAVAMREIDSLPPVPRRVLRLASVLGRAFDRRLLEDLLEGESVGAGEELFASLRSQLLADPEGRQMSFRHALLQEAAYQSLPFRQRLELHRRVGETIERETEVSDETAAVLSYHFLAAQDWERTWLYARKAARSAQRAHAPAETAIHLQRAVVAARRLGNAVQGDLADLYTDLGHTLEILGEYERADDAYRRAGIAAGSDPMTRGQIAYCRAYLRSEYLGRPSTAIRLLRGARNDLQDLGAESAGLHALLLAEEADVRQRQGRLAEAIACGRRAVEEAERTDDTRALARALHALSSGLVKAGRVDEVDFMDQVLELYRELGDEVSVTVALGNIATVAFFAGEWDKAADYLALCADASAKSGDLANAAMADGNLGELRANQGRLDESVALLTPARRTLESFGYVGLTAAVSTHLGRAHAFLGDVDGGLATIEDAARTLHEIGSHYESLDAHSRLAEVLVSAGRLNEARAALARARAYEKDVGDTPLSSLIDRIELTLDVASEDRVIGAAEVGRFCERARRFDATYEELVVLALAERSGDRSHHTEVERLCRDLGVVTLPMLPVR